MDLLSKLWQFREIDRFVLEHRWHSHPGSTNSFVCSFLTSENQLQEKAKLSLCLTNYALRHEGVWGSGCIDPHILDVGTSWRWVVSFIPRQIYPWRNSPRYPLDRRQGGPHKRSGRRGEQKISSLSRATPALKSIPTIWKIFVFLSDFINGPELWHIVIFLTLYNLFHKTYMY
jgi:hypothetical protein